MTRSIHFQGSFLNGGKLPTDSKERKYLGSSIEETLNLGKIL